jgi:hypothetical protein
MQPFPSYYPQAQQNKVVRQICIECGDSFESRASIEPTETICDACYSGQFEPLRVPMWQRVKHNLRAR